MNIKSISDKTLALIEQYKDVPYFNNKTVGRRAGLRVEAGKGNPKEISEEVETIARLNKINTKDLSIEDKRRLMVENNIGIDCSGFAYYVLNEEGQSRGKGDIGSHLHFVKFSNPIRRLIAKIRPIENSDVITFADNNNSKLISLREVQAGDMVTMIGNRNHILIVESIEYEDSLPKIIHYVHAISWPTDGEYGHGIHRGKIVIVDHGKSLIEQNWIELDKTGPENYTFYRAKESQTELRRLNWFD